MRDAYNALIARFVHHSHLVKAGENTPACVARLLRSTRATPAALTPIALPSLRRRVMPCAEPPSLVWRCRLPPCPQRATAARLHTRNQLMCLRPSLCACVFSPQGYSGVSGTVLRDESMPTGSLPGRGMWKALRRGPTREYCSPSEVWVAPCAAPPATPPQAWWWGRAPGRPSS